MSQRRLLRGICIGIASGATAGSMWAALSPGFALGRGAVIGIIAGAVAGGLFAVVQRPGGSAGAGGVGTS